jgi:TRAP-type uncharacterized transport system substrate-binding protein
VGESSFGVGRAIRPAGEHRERHDQRDHDEVKAGRNRAGKWFRFLPVEGTVLKKLVAMGYRPTVMPKSRFHGMAEDITTVDFSGWPMIVRADMPDEAVYPICEAIEKRKDVIPTDNYKPLEMAQLCANDEEAPYDVPLHKGAARFYRERGYLK